MFLHQRFKVSYEMYNPRIPILGGRPRLLDTYSCLGLCLHYLNSTMRQKTLQQLFGAPPAVVSREIRNGLQCLQHCLKSIPEAGINWPTPTEMQQYASIINKREPSLKHIWGFTDGTTFKIYNPSNNVKQNAYYSFTKSCTVVNNVFCFTADGCVCHATLNAPGSWHDAKLIQTQGGLIYMLFNHTPDPYCIVGDQGFHNTRWQNKIKTPLKNRQIITGTKQQLEQRMELDRCYISIRQAAEWGIRTIKGTFQRLTMPLPTTDIKRQKILMICVRLHNLRTRLTGGNQISTVYGTLYNTSINMQTIYDRVAQYYEVE